MNKRGELNQEITSLVQDIERHAQWLRDNVDRGMISHFKYGGWYKNCTHDECKAGIHKQILQLRKTLLKLDKYMEQY